ncbi:alpha/beta hydrolase family protein [Amaricoccus macauensis]|uniref:alpha/beta hydrolase family protein n=1 Tax=Amaricoccus macauensis TaxID=57001 RepID=UPI003C7C4F90
MSRFLALAVTLFLAGAADAAGVRQFAILSGTRGSDLDMTVWYPAGDGGDPVVLGENPFFEGTPAVRDAPIAAGRFPLVLLSHGAGLAGRAEAMSWIATPLADRGFVVAAPTHPGNTGPDRSAAETMKLWLRPTDLSEALDAIEQDEAFARQLDDGKVGVLGLSMGGHTALAMAGAQIDPAKLAAYCDAPHRNPSLCAWVVQSGVDLHAMDMTAAGKDHADGRIDIAMAIDPAMSDVFAAGTFAGVDTPVWLVNLGREGEVPASVDASGVAAALPEARYVRIEDASHFSMFGLCKPDASALAEEMEIEEPICSDGGSNGSAADRALIHARIIELAAEAFGQAWVEK